MVGNRELITGARYQTMHSAALRCAVSLHRISEKMGTLLSDEVIACWHVSDICILYQCLGVRGRQESNDIFQQPRKILLLSRVCHKAATLFCRECLFRFQDL